MRSRGTSEPLMKCLAKGDPITLRMIFGLDQIDVLLFNPFRYAPTYGLKGLTNKSLNGDFYFIVGAAGCVYVCVGRGRQLDSKYNQEEYAKKMGNFYLQVKYGFVLDDLPMFL